MSFGRSRLAEWCLDPDITYLNHGTVGAVPRRVLAEQQAWRDRMERQPSQFMLRDLVTLAGRPRREPGLLRQAVAAVADFIGAAPADVAFVDNVTTGVNGVLRSIDLNAGDDILLTDHGYGAVAHAASFAARESGVLVRSVEVPYPRFNPHELVERIDRAIGPRTRVLIVDHITSESALILPVAAIAARCRIKGVKVLIDGAHAPGVLPLDIPSLGVDWYSANLHKWAHAPRSCGFLWAAPEHQAHLHPLVISWGLDSGFTAEFDWIGTRDPTPFLSAPEGIAFLRELGEPARAWNHDLAWRAARELTARWKTPLDRDEASVGAMVTIALPESFGDSRDAAAGLRDALLFEDRIEVQLHPGYGRLWVRVSAQIYNEWADIERLGEAIDRRG